MHGNQEPGRVASPFDEIAGLARSYLEDPRSGGIHEIEEIIEKATDESRWDDVGKWHRVRLRLLRYKQQRVATARMLMPSGARF